MAIQSILRSRTRQEKPTDCRDVTMAYISFDSIRSPEYVGTLSAVKVVYPLRESFDSMYMHHYKYDSKVQHEQLIVYQTEEELLRLGAWLGQANFSMHRRGARPKLCRPLPVHYDDLNVVHPKFARTRIVIKYNVQTWMARITVSYQRVGPVAPGQEHHFLPSGDCTLPALPPSEPDLDDHAAEEYTDAVLQGEQVEHAAGVYEITTVADTCSLSLVAGSGPQVLHVPRDEAVRLTALAFGLAPPMLKAPVAPGTQPSRCSRAATARRRASL